MKRLYKQTKRMLLFMLALVSFGYASAQIEVSGTLNDSKGPLIGGAITEKGTSNGTYTYDGTWTLTVSSPDAVLEFSMMGYVTKEMKVGSQRTFDVKLSTDAVLLDAVQVIGYTSVKPEDQTSGQVSMNAKDFEDKPFTGVDQAIQGKAAGVSVASNSGSPGEGMNIVVGGLGTTGDARPLWIVDGVPSGYEYKGDPSNIQDLVILKDASALAQYGARGANGVILVTTKGGNGVAGDGEAYSSVSFDMYRGVQSAWKKIDVANAEEYAQIKNQESILNGGDSIFTASDIAGFESTDWQDEVFRDAIIQKYRISVDGGSAKSSWSVGGGYINQEGIVRGTSYEKYNIGYKMMYRLNDKVDFGVGSGFNLNQQDKVNEGQIENSLIGSALIADPTIPVYDSTGNWSAAQRNTYANPVGTVENNYDRTSGYGVGANAWVKYQVTDNLFAKTQWNYGFWEKDREQFYPVYWISINQSNSETLLKNNIQGGNNWGTTNLLEYSKKFYNSDSTREIHSFKFLAGQEALYEFQETYNIQIPGIGENDAMRYIIAGRIDDSKVWVETWEAPNEHTMLSYFGRVEYSLLDKYPINFTLRRDGSSRFGSERKWGNFPSVGAAWKINKEQFFQGNEFLVKNITLLKLRGGWGKIGNENIGNYKYVASNINDPKSGYNLGGSAVTGSVPLSVPNADLHWEEATSWRIGTDITTTGNHLEVSLDYFQKKNVDNLIKVNVPAVVGIDGSGNNPLANAGEIFNKGFEGNISYRNNFNTDSLGVFDYSVGVNFTKVNNEVTYLADSELPGGEIDRAGVFVSNTLENYPIASFFGYKVDGIFQDWAEVNEGSQSNAKPGDYRIVDVNGDGQITTDDITMIGSPHADFTYGMNANVKFMGFDLGIQFQGVQGNDIFNATKWFLDGGYLSSNMSTRRLDIWTPENTGSDQPTDANWFTGKDASFANSAYIEDGSYLRLKNITLGYTVKKSISQKLKLNKLRVYGQIQNALTFTKYTGFDPEIGTNTTLNYAGPEFGIDRGVYPQARTVMFGVNLEF